VQQDASAPVVCLQSWVRVGSRFEKEGKTGICHLFEHLMFGETEDVAHGAFDRLLEEAGAETNAARLRLSLIQSACVMRQASYCEQPI